MTLCERIKYNYNEVKNGLKVREFYQSLIYFIILGGVVPSFTDYFYYYLQDEAGITEF